ncbi:MAG: hypothetical protein EOL86_09165 [Deltaproteobacteria bacterium]|nr:hypothetical protein [Deltaproteobacteria bacterium]
MQPLTTHHEALREEVDYRARRLAALGSAISSIAIVLGGLHSMREMEVCPGCDYLPPELLSGYTVGGLHSALEELGGNVSHISDIFREMTREGVQ